MTDEQREQRRYEIARCIFGAIYPRCAARNEIMALESVQAADALLAALDAAAPAADEPEWMSQTAVARYLEAHPEVLAEINRARGATIADKHFRWPSAPRTDAPDRCNSPTETTTAKPADPPLSPVMRKVVDAVNSVSPWDVDTNLSMARMHLDKSANGTRYEMGVSLIWAAARCIAALDALQAEKGDG